MVNTAAFMRYGTSGFRMNATFVGLGTVVLRSAFYAAYRSSLLGQPVGLMLTASHNPWQDNGVKLVEPSGQMLPVECEAELERIVNDYQAFEDLRLKNLEFQPLTHPNKQLPNAMVIIGTDTRPSAGELMHYAKLGCELAKIEEKVFEQVTTPILHILVVMYANNPNIPPLSIIDDYVSDYLTNLEKIFKLIPLEYPETFSNELFVDCANGVGAIWMGQFGHKNIDIKLKNTAVEKPELLNKNCGADYVKIARKLPSGFETLLPGTKCATMDGDADRAIYFCPLEDGTVKILDGDHIAALFAKFIIDRLNETTLKVGVVQTAYANGNSTRFFAETLGLQPVIVKTGVKYLAEAAHRLFHIGIYFEANGHGTVTYSKSISGVDNLLSAFLRLINPVIGDGIANVIAVETVLRYFGWSLEDWEANTYTNLPSTQLKVPVLDRSVFVTHDDYETELVKPEQMQEKIDSMVSEYPRGRAFIRPSGTEQIVRVYAEAETQEKADELAEALAQMIRDVTAIV